MKRCLAVGGALIVSLLVGWASAYTASKIDWPPSQRALAGCREAGHCAAPAWLDGLLLAWLVGPPLVFGAAALAGLRQNWPVARWVWSFGALSALTAGFYFAWYLFGA